MSSTRPVIVARNPDPRQLAPVGTRRFSITFDRPMDTSRGRCRLAWSRLRLHTKNLRMPAYDWDVRSREVAWSPDGRTLSLTLPTALVDGHRVRVEWSELGCAAAGRPPVPEAREEGASYVVAVAGKPHGPPAPPRFGGLPVTGSTGARRDLTLELYADQPLAPYTEADFEVWAGDERIPFHLHTNRNPPDWIYLQLEALLPPDTRVEVRSRTVRSTLGARVEQSPLLHFRTGRAEPMPAVPRADWSEPLDGRRDHPTGQVEAALRCEGQPILRDIERIRAAITVRPADGGPPVAGITADLDPTPAHYRTVFVRSGPGFRGLAPGTDYVLSWDHLGWPGVAPSAPGEVRFRTADHPSAARPLVPCPHVMLVADNEGTRLQVAVQVFGELAAARVEEPAVPGFRAHLTPMKSPRFRDMVQGDLRVAPPVLWSSFAAAPTLQRAEQPSTRHFTLVLTEPDGTERRIPTLAFDMTPAAIQDLAVEVVRGRPRASWRLGTPTDSQHLSIHDPSGRTWFAGLLEESVDTWELPSGWTLPAGRYLFQMWLLRATPEDDLWDFAVADRWFEVTDEAERSARP